MGERKEAGEREEEGRMRVRSGKIKGEGEEQWKLRRLSKA
jgi:hypothetical protein